MMAWRPAARHLAAGRRWLVLLLAVAAVSRGDGATSAERLVGRPPQPAAVARVDPVLLRQAEQRPVTFLVRTGPGANEPAPAPAAARDAEALQALLAAGAERVRPVEVGLRALQARGGVHHVESFPAFGVVAATGDAAAIRAAAGMAGVLEVRADWEHRLVAGRSRAEPADTAWHLRVIGADRAWREHGSTGEGVTVATIDTGADWRHPLLRHAYRGRDGRHDYDWADFSRSVPAPAPEDGNGHGTQVMGLLAGSGAGGALGVAPGVEWIAVRAFDDRGRSSDLRLLRAAQWILAPTDSQGARPRPDLAPHVVNGSWVLENGADPLYVDVVAAWRAAGIVPVFAAGNAETLAAVPAGILAPASYGGVLSVGATDERGAPWAQSVQGPGFYGGVKPDLVAPGVRVLTAGPEGATAYGTGTSMAAPQAAGAVALALSVNPALTVDDALNVVRASARDLAPPGPDAATGWGALDVRAAVGMAASAGQVRGRVAGAGHGPVAGAAVTAERLPPGDRYAGHWRRPTDSDGRYVMALPEGSWRVSFQAFGLVGTTVSVTVVAGQATQLDAILTAAPSGTVTGRVTGPDGRAVVGARIDAVGAPPAWGTLTDATGRYGLDLPAGERQLRVTGYMRRAVTETVSVRPGEVAERSVILQPAPKLLLVDADAAAGERIHPYLERALHDAGYVADTWVPRSVADLPTALDLASYDAVLWAHLYGSPGRAGAAGDEDGAIRLLRSYAAGGGRLIVSGQDVGADGAAHARPSAARFYEEVLGARLRSPITLSSLVRGVGPFEGLELQLGWPTGHLKAGRRAPDVVEPVAPSVVPVLHYDDGQPAGLAASDGHGRRVYLAFGVEGAGDGVALARLLDRAVGWLQAPELRLTAAPRHVDPGGATTLTLDVFGHRASQVVTVRAWSVPAVTLDDADDTWTREGPHALRWSGMLEAERARAMRFTARLTEPAGGAVPLTITAAVQADSRAVTTSLELRARAPDLGSSHLTFHPARPAGADRATLALVVSNTGLVPATGATALLSLPPAMTPLGETLQASSGRAEWLAGEREAAWRGDVAAGDRVTVSLMGGLPDGVGREHGASALMDDGAGSSSSVTATALVGGPDLRPSTPGGWPEPLYPGAEFVVPVTVTNRGRAPASAAVSLALPADVVGRAPQDAGQSVLTRGLHVPPGGEGTIGFDLAVSETAPDGARVLRFLVDDGARPPRPVGMQAEVEVLRPALHASRAVLLPSRARSGDWVTGTVLVANLGRRPVTVHVVDSLAPALVLDPARVAVSRGTLDVRPATLQWTLQAAPPASDGSWSVGAGSLRVSGVPLARDGPVGAPAPVALDFAFPFVTEVYTRAWVLDRGLLGFGEPGPVGAARGEPAAGDGLAPGSVAPLWWPGATGGALPLVRRSAEGITFTWPSAGPSGPLAATLHPDGRVRFDYGAGPQVVGAAVGVRAPDGRSWLVEPDLVSPATSLTFHPPGGWERLDFRAQVRTGLEPNSRVEHAAWLRAPGFERRLTAALLANSLDLAASRLDGRPGRPVAGGLVRYRLELVADGVVEARNLDLRLTLPLMARLLPESLEGGLTAGETEHDLVWRGRIPAGDSASFGWSVRVPADVTVGAGLTSRALVRGHGLEPLAIRHTLRVAASDFAGSTKRASRSVAWPGERVAFTLRAVNSGLEPVSVTLVDSLPPGMTYVVGSAGSSAGSAPEWRADARAVTWSGELEAGTAVDLWLAAQYVGPGRQSNVMTLEDGRGTAYSAWADVYPAAARAYLPAALGGRH